MKQMMKTQMEAAIANVPQMIEGEYESMFEEYDTNKNGVIDKDEAKEMFKKMCVQGAPQGYEFTEENFAAKFKEWDVDGSGTISKDEIKTLIFKNLTDTYKESMALYGI